jgi:hypothetical protein
VCEQADTKNETYISHYSLCFELHLEACYGLYVPILEICNLLPDFSEIIRLTRQMVI